MADAALRWLPEVTDAVAPWLWPPRQRHGPRAAALRIEEELEALLPALGECLRRPGAEAAQARLHWITDA